MGEIHKRLHDLAIKLSVYSSILDFGLMLSVLLVGYKVFPEQISSMLLSIFTRAITYITLTTITFFLLAFVIKNRSMIINIRTTPRRTVFSLLNRGQFTPPVVRKVKVYTVGDKVADTAQPVRLSNVNPPREAKVNYVRDDGKLFVNLNGVWLAAGKDRFLKVKRPYVEY
ncbi:MAG: hypothetical protein OH316_02340 [Candidatus Parvarchaeota archaeon]|nr:hypothetical protein [Candidatus Parvarchaeota archaeon]